jgi:chaperonin GroES
MIPEKILYSEEVYDKNLAELLIEENLNEISQYVYNGFEVDEDSCEEWWKRTEPAIKLAMQYHEPKNFPFTNAASIKYPLLSVAAMQFAARAYPMIVKDREIVKGKVVGDDVMLMPDPQTGQPIPVRGMKTAIATRISHHMSYQILEEMEEWEDELDTALTVLPIIGEEWKKTYFDVTLKRNKSCRVSSENIVINYKAKSVDQASRITERVWLYPNEVVEKIRSGWFIDHDFITSAIDDDKKQDTRDEDSPVLYLEQHCYFDMDEDGYKEPYIITIHKETKQVVRIYPRFELKDVVWNDDGDEVIKIVPVLYFTQTVFFRSPDGGCRGMGFGNLLGPINEAINATINQLIDSGTLYNSNSGFIGKGVQLNKGRSGGTVNFQLNEWKQVNIPGDDLRKAMVPLPVREPSTVLFSLLGTMISAGKELSSVSEVMTGEHPTGSNIPATSIMALIEQGVKIFSSIYKRIYRSLKKEFKKLYRLNSIYLDDRQYFRVMDTELAITRQDYNIENIDVIPVADPAEVSEVQKIMKAQMLIGMVGQGFNDQEIRRRYLDALEIPDKDNLMLPDEAFNQPDPEMELRQRELALEESKFQWQMITDKNRMFKDYAMATKALAQAQEAQQKVELEYYAKQMDYVNREADRVMNYELKRMEGRAGNTGGEESPEGQEG